MSTWRLAKSLEVLRAEFDLLAPNRRKTRDGTIGDAAHASRPSRHNPNVDGVVCALDITDDPAGGCPVHDIANGLIYRLQQGGTTNPDIEYIISNRFVASRTSGWKWLPYTGPDPHDLHAHFAVGRGPDSAPAFPYDDTTPWNIANTVQEDTVTEQDKTDIINAVNTHVDARVNTAVDAAIVRLERDINAITPGNVSPAALEAAVSAAFREAFKS